MKCVKYLLLVLCLVIPSFAACVGDTPDPGCVHYAHRTDSGFDQYINGTALTQQWIAAHFNRMETSPGWFDPNLGWYKGAWGYYDSLAIYNPSALALAHPEWILKDTSGKKLYIDWGCHNGSCPQYAADIANPSYRAYWIANAARIVQSGYKGIWVDDVNLGQHLAYGDGSFGVPVDRATGRPMTDQAWSGYFATFMTEVRSAFPNTEILHNSMWYAGTGNPGSDPNVQQEIRAATYINRERGVSDPGLTGGTGYWSLRSLLTFFDTVHSLGANVDIQEFNFSGDYGPACYFLISQGSDMFGNDAITPYNWPANYDVVLGAPLGARYEWNGLLRRDFVGGTVLVNSPGDPSVTTVLPSGYTDLAGNAVTNVTVQPRQGMILLKPAPPKPPQTGIVTGDYVITNSFSGMVLDDPGSSSVSGIQIVQQSPTGGRNQSWHVAVDSTGVAMIRNNASGLYLTDSGGSLQQVWYGNSLTKRWTFVPTNDGYAIKNVASSLVADDPGLSTVAGAGIITWAANGGSNQVWTLK